MHDTRGAWVLVLGCVAALLPAGRASAWWELQEEYVLESQTGDPQAPIRVPEGVAFDPWTAEFFASGIFGGRITRIDGHTGDETTLFQEQGNPALAFGGLKVAPVRRVAWVCAVDFVSLSSVPTSCVYAISVPAHGEGTLLRKVELPQPFFCNDVALDLPGNVYVTNSVGDAVMKISPRVLWDASAGAEVFARSDLLAPVPVDGEVPLTMNGIAVTPGNRYLIVARDAPAQLLRISLADPTDIVPLTFTGDAFAQGLGVPDGIVFARGKLYVVFVGGVQRLRFDWGSEFLQAEVSTTLSVPFGLTTAANVYGEVYVIDSEIHALSPELGFPVELPHRIVHLDRELF